MTVRETFLTTVVGWVFLAAFGALPFCLAEISLSPARGFFESMSGITTTGLTTITGLDSQPAGILLWRALLHWIGGVGGLVAALTILPLLQVSGQQVFRAESPDVAKVLPSANQMAAWICVIYMGMTLACALLLHQSGMTGIDALCHAMTAVSTGGFSTSDGSMLHFTLPVAEVVLMVFMLLSALPYTLYLRMARGDFMALVKDEQVQAFLGLVCFFSACLALYLLFDRNMTFEESLRRGLFRAVALMTTSGLTLEDDILWGPATGALFFIMAFIGGCSGSTTGGVRVFRVQIFVSMIKRQIRQLIEPNGVFQAHYNRKPVETDTLHAVAIFFLAFVFLILAGGTLLALTGIPAGPAFTSAFAAVSNTSAALSSSSIMLAPLSESSQTAHWILSACMLLGRMEIFTVLVLFAPRFWRR